MKVTRLEDQMKVGNRWLVFKFKKTEEPGCPDYFAATLYSRKQGRKMGDSEGLCRLDALFNLVLKFAGREIKGNSEKHKEYNKRIAATLKELYKSAAAGTTRQEEAK